MENGIVGDRIRVLCPGEPERSIFGGGIPILEGIILPLRSFRLGYGAAVCDDLLRRHWPGVRRTDIKCHLVRCFRYILALRPDRLKLDSPIIRVGLDSGDDPTAETLIQFNAGWPIFGVVLLVLLPSVVDHLPSRELVPLQRRCTRDLIPASLCGIPIRRQSDNTGKVCMVGDVLVILHLGI